MSLLPGSGFQSFQFRSIEIYSTPIKNLLIKEKIKKSNNPQDIQNIYWSKGATELKSGKKTYTLTQFQKKYNNSLSELAVNMKRKNVWLKFKKLHQKSGQAARLETPSAGNLLDFQNFANKK